MAADALIVPNLQPVDPEAIVTLEKRISVPVALKEYWSTLGQGFFIEDANGELVDPDVANRLVGPDEVLDLLENAEDLKSEFAHGVPFFERNDRRYLLIDPQGRIVSADVELCEVSPSFADFINRIVRDPFFYDEGVEVEEVG